MQRFIQNIKKYYKYAIYSGNADLKSEIANSYLSWLWWILEPICFMLIYIFIAQIVFKSQEPHFPVFVFIGITTWDFFSKMIINSVKLFSNNKSIISKVYIPKYILLVSKSFIHIFKFFISFGLIILLMVIFKMNFSANLLFFIPIFVILYIITFGISSIIMHFGTYVEDLFNVVNIVLKLIFYLSGIFYNISSRVPTPLSKFLLSFNPIAIIIDEFRKIFIYGQFPNFQILGIWLFVGIILTAIGVKIIHKYENSYAKVI